MILIKNGLIVNSDNSFKGNIIVDDDKIIKITDEEVNESGYEVIDATNCFVFPGMIDGHTHFDMDAGIAYTADTFETGTKAALVGGTTTVVDFATQNKKETLHHAYYNWLNKAKDKSSCNYRFHMAITDYNSHVEKEMERMKELGVTSYKLYMAYDNLYSSDDVIYACLKKVKELNGVLGVHCENGTLINKLIKDLVDQNKKGPSSHPLSRPAYLEAEAINRLCYIAKMVDYPVNIVHLSSKEGLKEVLKAREDGLKVTAETCPQYLLLNDDLYNLGDESSKYVMSPPLRKDEDRNALIEAIKNNQIDTIATDHCSFNYKTCKSKGFNDFRLIPNGGPGVEHRLLLIYTYLVDKGIISVNKMVELLSTNPAKLYNLYPKKGLIKEDSEADIVIYDPNYTSTIKASNQTQNVDYTPYEGFEVKGKVRDVILNGKIVVKDSKIVLTNQGKYAK